MCPKTSKVRLVSDKRGLKKLKKNFIINIVILQLTEGLLFKKPRCF